MAFTEALEATMVDDDKLAFDIPISNYLRKFVDFEPYVTRWMTMRDLLAHRTGWSKFAGNILTLSGIAARKFRAAFIILSQPSLSGRWRNM